ncbi:MAG: hypothetical protein F6J96_36190 [Symploca sp. SIO1C2]|nr:hypothetical protein [Symploca sp. SIO1C2]
MDIQVSSNFERALFDALGRDGEKLRGLMSGLQAGGFELPSDILANLRAHFDAGRVDEEETLATIKRWQEKTQELLCPHTAVGVAVAEAQRDPSVPMITLATAHPAKFPAAVERATGLHPPLPAHMADLYERAEHITEVPNDLRALQALIGERARLDG